MSADTAWAEHTDAYAIGRASRDAEVAELEAKLEAVSREGWRACVLADDAAREAGR